MALFCIALTIFAAAPAAAQEQVQQNPLVTTTQRDGNNPATVWELVVPQRPRDTNTRLTYERLLFGFSQIQNNPDKLPEFLHRWQAEVMPPGAWTKAETLVLEFAGDGLLTADTGNVHVGPQDIRIIKDGRDIERYFGLDPAKFNPVIWGGDPMSRDGAPITNRKELLRYAEVIEKRIDSANRTDLEAAAAWKRAMLACFNQEQDSDTCKDVPVSELPFLERNYGRGENSVGENEVYDSRTNARNARMTIYWVEELKTWKGNGWECKGNPLSFFTWLFLSADVVSRGFRTPSDLLCAITPAQVTLTDRSQVAEFNLTTTPENLPEDAVVEWFRTGDKGEGIQASRNSKVLRLPGTLFGLTDAWYSVCGRVTAGGSTAACKAQVMVKGPVMPPPAPVKSEAVPPPAETPKPRCATCAAKKPKCGSKCIAGIAAGAAGIAAVALLAGGKGASKTPTAAASSGCSPAAVAAGTCH